MNTKIQNYGYVYIHRLYSLHASIWFIA